MKLSVIFLPLFLNLEAVEKNHDEVAVGSNWFTLEKYLDIKLSLFEESSVFRIIAI